MRPSAIRPEINVTPLVDVVLVLLIIFMVIAPQLEAGEQVDLPAVRNVAAKSTMDAITVTLTRSENILVEKERVALADLAATLQRAHDADPEKKLVLKADRGVKYGFVRPVFAVAQTITFRGIALLVDQRPE